MEEHETLAKLLDLARAGDRAAFETLARGAQERLLEFVRSRIGLALRGRLDPDDVVQEALVRAWESAVRFRGTDGDTFRRWLASIAEHLIWNASRKRSLKEASLSLEISDDRVSPSRGLRREERLVRLQQSLARLTAEQREVVILAKIEGLSSKEIGERTGRSDDAVRQLLSRGLRALRDDFGDTDSLHLPHRDRAEGADGERR